MLRGDRGAKNATIWTVWQIQVVRSATRSDASSREYGFVLLSQKVAVA